MSPFLERGQLIEEGQQEPNLNGVGPKPQEESKEQENIRPSPPAEWAADFERIHDLVCVGFGPASLAIVVAMADALDSGSIVAGRKPDICCMERQAEFAWHAGMLLPGTKMQISFIKDLATLRNPRSKFTFLNYLRCHNRLVQFSNLGTFLPSRTEFQDYLGWCANHFKDSVEYGREVEEILPLHMDQNSKVKAFTVRCRDIRTGKVSRHAARNVVIAIGGLPHVPSFAPQNHSRVIHSSQYASKLPEILPEREKPYHFAVVGGGQSAAEIFHDLHTRYPNAQTTLILRDTALRPSDDSPFVNEVFDPGRVSSFYCGPDEARNHALKADRSTNYSVVRLELLEQIYHDLYHQRIHCPDERLWQHRILTSREVQRIEAAEMDGSGDQDNSERLLLILKNIDPLRTCDNVSPTVEKVRTQQSAPKQPPSEERKVLNGTSLEHKTTANGHNEGREQEGTETLQVDAIFLATGYVRNAHEKLLQPLQHLRPPKASSFFPGSSLPTPSCSQPQPQPQLKSNSNPSISSCSSSQTWQIQRNYALTLDPQKVDTSTAGIWLQGCNESTHGLADTLLSTLATRGGEIVESIFGDIQRGQ